MIVINHISSKFLFTPDKHILIMQKRAFRCKYFISRSTIVTFRKNASELKTQRRGAKRSADPIKRHASGSCSRPKTIFENSRVTPGNLVTFNTAQNCKIMLTQVYFTLLHNLLQMGSFCDNA